MQLKVLATFYIPGDPLKALSSLQSLPPSTSSSLSEIYIQEIGKHYRLDRIFFLVPKLLTLVIEINEREFKIVFQILITVLVS